MDIRINANQQKFHALTPCDNLSDDVYFEALDAALATSNVTNVAVTGHYGSGKSSVIKSYLKARKELTDVIDGQPINAVSISLVASNAQKETSPQTIEYEILEQLFFKVKANVIPDSRFSRIHEIPRHKLWHYAGMVILTIAAFLYLYSPITYYSWFHMPLCHKTSIYFTIISLVICACTIGYAVYKVSRIIIGATIQKISLKVADVDLGNSITKSVLNQHIDELIYLFHKTKWNLVVFEDLDRFDRADIFIKLKEVNHLLNNSDEISQRVVFVYAVKDKLFSDKMERTKFFDFIVPIVPYVDGNNSDEILRNELKNYSISNKLCDILAYYVDDMRLIYNICNEFKIYRGKIFLNDVDLSNDRELAMIAYKNIYPEDFDKLMRKEGILYNALNQKEKIIQQIIVDLNKQLEKIKQKQTLKIYNVDISKKMLRLEYVAAIEKHLSEYQCFSLENKRVYAEDLVRDENFDRVVRGDLQCWNLLNRTYQSFKYSFAEIEKSVNKESYSKRYEKIEKFATNDELTADAYVVEQKIRVIKQLTWMEIISQYNPTIFENIVDYTKEVQISCDKQRDLILMLMQFGFINEHYKEYTSLFHESSLQMSDKKFLLNVYRGVLVEPTYVIQNPHRVLEKIDDEDFNIVACTNNSLVKELFRSPDFDTKKKYWLGIISEERQDYIKYVGQLLTTEDNVSNIVYEICNVWPNIWVCLKEQKQFNQQKILKSILLYASISKIPQIFSKNEEILRLDPNYFFEKQWFHRLSEVALKLQLKFTRLDNITPNIRDFIVANELYAINLHMLKAIVSENLKTKDFARANYTYIKSNPKLVPIAKYIDAHIGEYIDAVWRQLLSTEESEQNIRFLIDNENLTEEQRHIIIQKCTNDINEFEELQNPELNVELLLREGKLAPTWENVMSVYNWYDCSFDDALNDYLNLPLIYRHLAISKIPKTSSVLDNEQILAFRNELLYNVHLLDDTFRLLMHSLTIPIPWTAASLPEARVLLLMKEDLIPISTKIYNFIKTNYKFVHIEYLIKHRKMLLPMLSANAIDSSDIALLSTMDLKKQMATSFIKHMSVEAIQESANIEMLTKFSANDNRLSKAQHKAILFNQSVPAKTKIMRYHGNPLILNMSDLRTFLQRLGKEYLNLLHSRAVIPYSTENEVLVELLRQTQYVSSYKIKKQINKIDVYMHK